MALLNKDCYIKMLPYGDFQLYASMEEREITKNCHSVEEIRQKYEEIILELEQQAWIAIDGQHRFGPEFPECDTPIFNPEWRHTHPEAYKRGMAMVHAKDEELASEWNTVCNERNLYLQTVIDDSVSFEEFSEIEFPIMIEIYPDMHLSKIRAAETGSFHLDLADVSEVYEEVKRLGFFGETEDV